jgi:hypothetical protein
MRGSAVYKTAPSTGQSLPGVTFKSDVRSMGNSFAKGPDDMKVEKTQFDAVLK